MFNKIKMGYIYIWHIHLYIDDIDKTSEYNLNCIKGILWFFKLVLILCWGAHSVLYVCDYVIVANCLFLLLLLYKSSPRTWQIGPKMYRLSFCAKIQSNVQLRLMKLWNNFTHHLFLSKTISVNPNMNHQILFGRNKQSRWQQVKHWVTKKSYIHKHRASKYSRY